MPIYTKKGDKGQTGLPGDRRLSKADQLFETLGYLDQTSALIGLAVSFMEGKADAKLIEALRHIQSTFLSIGACLASEKPTGATILSELPGLSKAFEDQIDEWDNALPSLRNFILAGGVTAGAVLHLARASVRHSERQFHRLPEELKLAEIGQYLNRLSDYFFQAARFYNHQHSQSEAIWKSNSPK